MAAGGFDIFIVDSGNRSAGIDIDHTINRLLRVCSLICQGAVDIPVTVLNQFRALLVQQCCARLNVHIAGSVQCTRVCRGGTALNPQVTVFFVLNSPSVGKALIIIAFSNAEASAFINVKRPVDHGIANGQGIARTNGQRYAGTDFQFTPLVSFCCCYRRNDHVGIVFLVEPDAVKVLFGLEELLESRCPIHSGIAVSATFNNCSTLNVIPGYFCITGITIEGKRIGLLADFYAVHPFGGRSSAHVDLIRNRKSPLIVKHGPIVKINPICRQSSVLFNHNAATVNIEVLHVQRLICADFKRTSLIDMQICCCYR